MATATCRQCSTPFESVRADAHYCGDACKMRAYRARRRDSAKAATVVNLVDRQARKEVTGVDPAEGLIERYVQAELGKPGVATALGQMCLNAARQLDTGRATGSAAATLMKRVEAMLETAVASQKVEEIAADADDPITWLERRVAGRIANAGA